MNTPAHVALNALLLGRGRFEAHWGAITAGSLLPDLPMVGFYLLERVGRGTPEQAIWGQLYFDPGWQSFFDAFNSLPLIAVAGLFAWRAGATGALAFLLGMGLHCLADLPLHREDAHAHFWPLTSWRFLSPVSYWDPAHGGLAFLGAELALLVAAPFVLRRRSHAWGRVGWITLAVSLVFVGFAVLTWAG
ncbi:MAG: zinc dependent phospholipase C family protein [Myxococcota bacterium]